MPSTKTALLAVALAVARLAAANPIGPPPSGTQASEVDCSAPDPCGENAKCVPANGSNDKDTCKFVVGENEECGDDNVCQDGFTCGQDSSGEMNVQVLTCIADTDTQTKRSAPTGQEWDACSKDSDCDDDMACRVDSRPGVNTETKKCQGIMTIMDQRSASTGQEWDSCSTDSECDGNMVCAADKRPGVTTETLKCQKSMTILDQRSKPLEVDGAKKEGDDCTEDDQCSGTMICKKTESATGLPATNGQCATTGVEGSDCATTDDCNGGLQCLRAECDNGSPVADCKKCKATMPTPLPARDGDACTSDASCNSNQECRPFQNTKMNKCQDKPDIA